MTKTILVTGSSSGIGRAIALYFAKSGYNIVINYLNNKNGAEEVSKEAEKLGSKSLVIQADVTLESDAEKLIQATLKEFGVIDILINNVGGYIDGDEWDGSSKVWEDTFKKNTISTLNVSKFAILAFQKQQSGVIINIASRYCESGQVDAIVYAAAKASVFNITQAYAKLLAPFGRANCISPGAVNTGYWLRAGKEEIDENLKNIPMGRFVEPEEVAKLAYYLCSDDAGMITGQNIFIDGGFNN